MLTLWASLQKSHQFFPPVFSYPPICQHSPYNKNEHQQQNEKEEGMVVILLNHACILLWGDLKIVGICFGTVALSWITMLLAQSYNFFIKNTFILNLNRVITRLTKYTLNLISQQITSRRTSHFSKLLYKYSIILYQNIFQVNLIQLNHIMYLGVARPGNEFRVQLTKRGVSVYGMLEYIHLRKWINQPVVLEHYHMLHLVESVNIDRKTTCRRTCSTLALEVGTLAPQGSWKVTR